jgi:carboxyl-terminal processing protease
MKSMKKSDPAASTPHREYLRSILLGAIAGLALALAFATGFFLRDLARVPPVAAGGDVTDEGYPLLDEVQNILDRIYLREQPEYTKRQYAAIRGVLDAVGDRYTFFIEPPVAASEADVLAGTYGGVGILIRLDAAGHFVMYPYPDSPAQKAGISDGDILVAINGTPVLPTDQMDAVDQQMRGEVKEDNGVEITAQKPDNTGLKVFVKFEVINVPSVLWYVTSEDSTIGYINIQRFTNRTPDELKNALTDLKSQNVKALILDLRKNAGGLVNESVQVASEFLDGGIVAYEESRDSERTFEVVDGGLATDSDLLLVVLVNQGTASAAELVAGAIRDRGRGILIGQKTYGKGTVQQIFPLSDGSSIHVTAAEWFTPSKTPLDGIGLEPDIPMIPPEDGRDVETGEAIRYLQQKLAEGSSS